MFAGRDGRAILAHLFRCEGLAVCLYSGTLRAPARNATHSVAGGSHLRQTCACKIQVPAVHFRAASIPSDTA